jgi:hypothetical protein
MSNSHSGDADLAAEETGQTYKTTKITACPNTGEIKATKFTGALSGNATTATTATRVKISSGSSDVERNIVVDAASSSGQNLYTISGVTANYKNGTITATGGFIGKLTGNADTATKATQDGSGNVITSTYATKAELANKGDSVKHTISQTDITAGTTPLAAGELYLVYE